MAAPLAITGLGCIGAPGAGLEAQRAALQAGRCGLTTQARTGLPLSQRMPLGVVTAALDSDLPRTAALALAAGREACERAGWARAHRRRLGLVVGTSTGGMPESEAAWFAGGEAHVDAAYRKQQMHWVSRLVADRLGIAGPLSTHSVACVSAACAVVEAAEWIRQHRVDACLVIGADANCRLTAAGFTSLQLVDPHGCRPLLDERAGMSLGEGAGALLLESCDSCRKRGGNPVASLRGWGLRGDGYHPTSPDPEATQLCRAIADALADAGCSAADIGWVNAHGTGTRDNDRTEAIAFTKLLPNIPVASSKRIYGHTMGAAAAIEGVAACLALIHGERYPSPGLDLGTPIAGLCVQRDCAAMDAEAVCSTSLAFGGMDAALVFGRASACD